jgi:hypothetical protein
VATRPKSVLASAERATATSRTAIDIPSEYATFCRRTSPVWPPANVNPVTAEIAKALVIWEQKQSVVDACESDIAKMGIARPRFSMNLSDRDLNEECQEERLYPEHFPFPIFPVQCIPDDGYIIINLVATPNGTRTSKERYVG